MLRIYVQYLIVLTLTIQKDSNNIFITISLTNLLGNIFKLVKF